ncbi:MAG: aromatic ring-hydroxylating dioxygenase subunit alpha [Rhodocyclaceae bacterium]|nr:aromatic ring-hydroxylating dioxygenase subunit alpha [Rhodocyclaceae bacterium]
MSAFDSPKSLTAARSQLPVAWYSNEALLALEQDVFFRQGPGYVGHELMVPHEGAYRTLEIKDHGAILVNQGGEIDLMSNVCRHRQALMLEGAGTLDRHIVCPLHRWTYDRLGSLVGAPHFSENPCLNLQRAPLQNWHGLLFEGQRDIGQDLAGMTLAQTFDFTGYKLDKVVAHECNYNWKTFIEVYLEDYHVAPFHPGLGGFVNCDELTWQFSDWYSIQRVGITSLGKPGSATYAKWHEQVLAQYKHLGINPAHGAVWLTYYPNIMVEWYPHVLVVSTLHPQGVDKTMNVVEFYYPEEIVEFEREFIEAEQAAYMETAIEDDEIGERMDRGRLALKRAGRDEVGPYQSPMEDGMLHFHEFYRRMLGDRLKAFAG